MDKETHVIYNGVLDQYYSGQCGGYDVWTSNIFNAILCSPKESASLAIYCIDSGSFKYPLILDITVELNLFYILLLNTNNKSINISMIKNRHIKQEMLRIINFIKIN
jgi:hypothetical protein